MWLPGIVVDPGTVVCPVETPAATGVAEKNHPLKHQQTSRASERMPDQLNTNSKPLA